MSRSHSYKNSSQLVQTDSRTEEVIWKCIKMKNQTDNQNDKRFSAKTKEEKSVLE